MEFWKCNILHFLTNRHSWDRLVNDNHKQIYPIAFSITTENFVEFEEKRRVIQCQRGRLSSLSPKEIFMAMLIKVWVEDCDRIHANEFLNAKWSQQKQYANLFFIQVWGPVLNKFARSTDQVMMALYSVYILHFL